MGQLVIFYGDSWYDPAGEDQKIIRDKRKTLAHERAGSSISLASFNIYSPLALPLQMSGSDKDYVIFFFIKKNSLDFLDDLTGEMSPSFM